MSAYPANFNPRGPQPHGLCPFQESKPFSRESEKDRKSVLSPLSFSGLNPVFGVFVAVSRIFETR